MKKENKFGKKHAQITVFIIIAIVLVAAGGTAYYTLKNSKTSEFFLRTDIKPTMDNIKSSIVGCSESSAKDSLDKIGIQGGYSSKPEKSLDLGWAFIPYYYDKGSFLIPAKDKIQSELAKEYEKEFSDCFSGINAGGFEIKKGISKTKILIDKGKVDFSMNMQISVAKEENIMKIQMKDAPVSIASKLYEILEIAKYITDSHKNNSEMICISCIGEMAKERSVYVNSFDLNDNTVLYVVSENKTSSETYSFEWLNRYNAKISTGMSAPTVPSGSKAV